MLRCAKHAQRCPIAKENWEVIDPRKFGYEVSVRPKDRCTDAEGRGKKTQYCREGNPRRIACVSFWRKINYFSSELLES